MSSSLGFDSFPRKRWIAYFVRMYSVALESRRNAPRNRIGIAMHDFKPADELCRELECPEIHLCVLGKRKFHDKNCIAE